MNPFLKLITGSIKVLLFMFLQRDTRRKNTRDRVNHQRRHQRGESSNLATDLLIAALLNGGSQ
jgi:hypothetical protein